MANSILHKRSSTANNKPSANALSYGEIAINYADAKAFIKNSSNVVVELGSNIGNATIGNLVVSTDVASNLIPSANITYDLGSPTRMWRDVYIGPGSLYVNGQKVLEDQSGTIVVAADVNQNLALQTTGTGDIELAPQATGVIAVKGTTQFDPAYNIGTTDCNALPISVGIKTDSVTAKTANTNLNLSGTGTGYVNVSGDMTVTGNLTVSGSSANLSVTSLSVQDNIVNISAETTGTPNSSINSGIQVVRGDEPNVQFRWNESLDKWQFTNDGTNYSNLVSGTDITTVGTLGSLAVTGAANVGNLTAGNISISTTADAITSTGTLTLDPNPSGSGGQVVIQGNLQVTGTTTTIDSTSISIADLNITVAKGAASAAAANGAGLTVDGANAQITYNSTGDKWTVNKAFEATQFNGSGAGLTSIPGANVTGTVASATTATSATSATTAGTVTTAAQANITSVGTLTSLAVSGAITVNSSGNATAIVNGGSNGAGNIGSSTSVFNTVFAKATSAQYADLAENYASDADYAPGTVVCFGGSAEVTACSHDADRKVAGVVSTNPAYIMNSGLDSQHVVAVALQGRVPTMVVGPVTKGDMMVSAGNGRARAEANPTVGSVIGKALENFAGTEGTIEVVVGRF